MDVPYEGTKPLALRFANSPRTAFTSEVMIKGCTFYQRDIMQLRNNVFLKLTSVAMSHESHDYSGVDEKMTAVCTGAMVN
jgi:hypothetical protein